MYTGLDTAQLIVPALERMFNPAQQIYTGAEELERNMDQRTFMLLLPTPLWYGSNTIKFINVLYFVLTKYTNKACILPEKCNCWTVKFATV